MFCDDVDGLAGFGMNEVDVQRRGSEHLNTDNTGQREGGGLKIHLIAGHPL